jgi:hypothetical protein
MLIQCSLRNGTPQAVLKQCAASLAHEKPPQFSGNRLEKTEKWTTLKWVLEKENPRR